MIENKEIKNFYDSQIGSNYENNYEFRRWFSNPRQRLDYTMTYLAIENSLKGVDFRNAVEAGPGPGTWTRIIYRRNPEASFNLIDISKAMKEQFLLEMRDCPNVKYIVGDVVKELEGEKCDLFFSSRMIEYLEDKDAFFEETANSMEEGATGIIVTKNPRYGFNLKSDSRFQHTGQLTSKEIKESLEKVGLKNVQIFPVIHRIPKIDRIFPFISEKLFMRKYKKPVRGELSRLIESYLVKFTK